MQNHEATGIQDYSQKEFFAELKISTTGNFMKQIKKDPGDNRSNKIAENVKTYMKVLCQYG